MQSVYICFGEFLINLVVRAIWEFICERVLAHFILKRFGCRLLLIRFFLLSFITTLQMPISKLKIAVFLTEGPSIDIWSDRCNFLGQGIILGTLYPTILIFSVFFLPNIGCLT